MKDIALVFVPSQIPVRSLIKIADEMNERGKRIASRNFISNLE